MRLPALSKPEVRQGGKLRSARLESGQQGRGEKTTKGSSGGGGYEASLVWGPPTRFWEAGCVAAQTHTPRTPTDISATVRNTPRRGPGHGTLLWHREGSRGTQSWSRAQCEVTWTLTCSRCRLCIASRDRSPDSTSAIALSQAERCASEGKRA